MNKEFIGNKAILTFGLDEVGEFMKVWEINKNAYKIEEIFIDNGYCLELTPLRRVY